MHPQLHVRRFCVEAKQDVVATRIISDGQDLQRKEPHHVVALLRRKTIDCEEQLVNRLADRLPVAYEKDARHGLYRLHALIRKAWHRVTVMGQYDSSFCSSPSEDVGILHGAESNILHPHDV